MTTSLDDVLEISIPPSTAFILVNGTTGPTKGKALVHLRANVSDQDTQMSPVFTNPWVSVETVFFAPLDPSLKYNLTITPQAVNSSSAVSFPNGIGIHSVTFWGQG